MASEEPITCNTIPNSIINSTLGGAGGSGISGVSGGSGKLIIGDGNISNTSYSSFSEIVRADFVFSVTDRKINIIKSRDTNFFPGDEINTITQINKLITELILNFDHPLYLPTLSEARFEEIKIEVSKLMENLWKPIPT